MYALLYTWVLINIWVLHCPYLAFRPCLCHHLGCGPTFYQPVLGADIYPHYLLLHSIPHPQSPSQHVDRVQPYVVADEHIEIYLCTLSLVRNGLLYLFMTPIHYKICAINGCPLAYVVASIISRASWAIDTMSYLYLRILFLASRNVNDHLSYYVFYQPTIVAVYFLSNQIR